jgi:hypothetical protein
MKTTILLAIALLFSLFTLSACGRDDYSDTKKDTAPTTRDTSATRDTPKQSSTETSSGASSREAGEKGKSGAVTGSGGAESVKTKERSASSGTSAATGGSTTSNSPDGRSTVASATRSDKDQTSVTKSQTIEGLLLKIEGDSFLVKDISGKEVKLTADSNTKKDGNLTIGDRIVARVEDRGTLASINKR